MHGDNQREPEQQCHQGTRTRTCIYSRVYSLVDLVGNTITNESTAGADASVEMPKLHNIKSFYAHDKQFNFAKTQRVGND